MSDTPKTDAAERAYDLHDIIDGPFPLDGWELARELERAISNGNADAERYRWLRAFSGHPLQVMDRNQETAYYETALDAAIDRERMGDCDTPARSTK